MKIIAATYRCSPFTANNFDIGCATDVDFTTSSGITAGSDTWPTKIRDVSSMIIFRFGVNGAATDFDDSTTYRFPPPIPAAPLLAYALIFPPVMVIASTIPLLPEPMAAPDLTSASTALAEA